MKCNEKKKIAVLIADMDEEYSSEILGGILQEARANHFDVFIFNTCVNSDEIVKHNVGQYNIYTLANLSEFDGAIVFSNLIQEHVLDSIVEELLQETDIPVVGIDSPLENHYCVGIENYRAMRAIVEHFIEHHGFTKINFIAGQSTNTDSRLRLQAYCDVLQEHGIPVEEHRIHPGTFATQHGRTAAKELLASGKELPQAVVCGNDYIAMGFISVLRENGIMVPEQIAVSGFDNIFEARNSVPRLTTVDRNLEIMGKEAVYKIINHLAGEPTAQKEEFPSVPIFAGSCGCEYEGNGDACDIRQRYLQMVDHHERYLAENNAMIEDLNDSNSYEDFLMRLRPYVMRLECDRFYFCLNREISDELKHSNAAGARRKIKKQSKTEGLAPVMSVALAYEFGAFAEYGDFDTEQMVPWNNDMPPGDHTFLFTPVYFGDVCQGYVMVENSEFALTSSLFRTWMINLSGGLENLRKQANLRYMFERLDKLYVTDYLTGLYNRFGFSRYTKESFQNCIAEQKQIMVLFADLDGLKKINDLYGHDKGDIAIKAVADALREACIQEEVYARFGGDEYVVYAADYNEDKAQAFCLRLDAALSNYNQALRQPFEIEASYGYELFVPVKGDSIDRYIDKADERMYAKKKIRYAEKKEEGTLIWNRKTGEGK